MASKTATVVEDFTWFGTRPRVLISAILLLALAVRIWGLDDRLPDASLGIAPIDDSVVEESDRTEMYRAWAMWEGGAKPLSLDPGTVGWPSLSFYLTLAIQMAYRVAWSMMHRGADTAAFVEHFATDPGSLFLAARAVGVLVGVWSIFLLYRVGRAATNKSTAVVAALFLALNPLHVELSQHVSDPNLLASALTLLLAPPLIRVSSDPGIRSLLFAAGLIGVAAGSKYVPGVFLLVLAYQVITGHRARAFKGRAAMASRLFLGVAVAGTAFLLSSPYVVLRGSSALAEIESQSAALTSDWVGQTTAPVALGEYLVRVLPTALTWPLYALSGVGLILAHRRGGAPRVLVLLAVTFLLANGLLSVAQGRYVLASIPVLLLCAAIVVTMAARGTQSLLRLHTSIATVLWVCGLSVIPVMVMATYRGELAKPDSRHAARRWIQESLHPSEPIALDLYGPVINSGKIERLAVAWPFYSSRADAVRAAYSPSFLQGLRYYVISGEVRRRFDTDSQRSPREVEFYSWLDRNGVAGWTSEARGLGGPRIDIVRLPAVISTRAERDSALASNSLVGCDSVRLARWCGDLATAHGALGRLGLVGEWAGRGASLAKGPLRRNLLGMAAEALLAQKRADRAIELLDQAVGEFPSNFDLLLLRGIALVHEQRYSEAASQLSAALRVAPDDPRHAEITAEIERLRAQ